MDISIDTNSVEHDDYKDFLTKLARELLEATPAEYVLINQSDGDGITQISYPQLCNMEDRRVEELANDLIRKIVIYMLNINSAFETEINYEIKNYNSEL